MKHRGDEIGKDMLGLRNGLAVAKTGLQRFESVSEVRESLRSHYENLERLSNNLRKLGIDEQTIDQNVIELFNEYKEVLETSIKSMIAGDGL